MDRRTTQRFIERIKVGNKAQQGNSGAPAGNGGGRRKLGKWVAWGLAGLAGFVVLSMALDSRQGYLGATTTRSAAPMPAATAAAAAPAIEAYAGAPGQSTSGAALPAIAADSAAQSQAPATGGASPQTQNQTTTQPWDRKIIRTATMQLTVKDVSLAVDKVQTLASLHGGLVFQEDSHQEGEYTVASVTIQVPSQEFDKIMPELKKLDGLVKKVGQSGVSSSDVTEEYTDLQSQLRNQQATEARILALQQKASQLSDILSLDQQLRQIQGDIERIQGRLNFLSKHADMSSITVSLQPEELPVAQTMPQPVSGWQPGEIALRAWNSSLDMLASVATVVITIGVFLWWAAPLILILVWMAIRARRRPAGASTLPPPPATATPSGGTS
jgi:hypothetical protein